MDGSPWFWPESQRLLSENLLPFQGMAHAMRLISNRNPFLAAQYPWEEKLQILRIDQLGNASVSGHIHGTEVGNTKKTSVGFRKSSTNGIKSGLIFFPGGNWYHDAFDAGTWELELVNTEGDTYRFTGDLCGQVNETLSMLLIRYAQGCKQILCLRLMVDGFRIIRYNAFHWNMHSAGKMKTWSRKRERCD